MYSPVWNTTEGPVMPGPLVMELHDQIGRITAQQRLIGYDAHRMAGAFADPDKPSEQRTIDRILRTWSEVAGVVPEQED